MKRLISLMLALTALTLQAQQRPMTGYVADLADGRYRNPIIYADYSDPDVIRVGDVFYMTSSSFNCIPGLQILTSHDLVNWTISGAALPHGAPGQRHTGGVPQHGNQVWAPSVRWHDGRFYIFYGDPDRGIYQLHADDALGRWSEPVLVMPGKGLIDPTPLWDDDGRCYLVHALAGSRAGLKSVLLMAELDAEAEHVVTPSRIIFDGHEQHPTCEGPKLYKRNGYYYIFTPAGGVSTGWQLVLRSKNIYGPYETHVALRQDSTDINGPHQGAWVQTQTGEDWFVHFQDIGAVGRIVHLQPMSWHNDWPVIGHDADGDGCGSPVASFRKPDVGRTWPIQIPQTSDRFDSSTLGLQWQWQAAPQPTWYGCDAAAGHLRLYSQPLGSSTKDNCRQLWNASNLLLQKISAPDYTAIAKVRFTPCPRPTGERAGLVVMGRDYAGLIFHQDSTGSITLSQISCQKADRCGQETTHAIMQVERSQTLWLRVRVRTTLKAHTRPATIDDYRTECTFSYSLDGKTFYEVDAPFEAREGLWIGAKVGLFCTKDKVINDSGWLDVLDFSVEAS